MNDSLSGRLRHLSSQENCDDEPYDTMVEAASCIDRLELGIQEVADRADGYLCNGTLVARDLRNIIDKD